MWHAGNCHNSLARFLIDPSAQRASGCRQHNSERNLVIPDLLFADLVEGDGTARGEELGARASGGERLDRSGLAGGDVDVVIEMNQEPIFCVVLGLGV